jgi:hypothetical protein
MHGTGEYTVCVWCALFLFLTNLQSLCFLNFFSFQSCLLRELIIKAFPVCSNNQIAHIVPSVCNATFRRQDLKIPSRRQLLGKTEASVCPYWPRFQAPASYWKETLPRKGRGGGVGGLRTFSLAPGPPLLPFPGGGGGGGMCRNAHVHIMIPHIH